MVKVTDDASPLHVGDWNEGYYFINWTKAGVAVSNENEYAFTVNDNAQYVANFGLLDTQTVTLAAGWNWISFNVEISLADLQSALASALPGTTMTVSGKNAISQYNGSAWSGSLNTLDMAQMYMIQVSLNCEITLSGAAVDPSVHPITILGGALTWIGYPLETVMTVEEAFAGVAVEGDVITGRTGSARYAGGRWRGSLTTLEPGNGYIYRSADADDKPFLFIIP